MISTEAKVWHSEQEGLYYTYLETPGAAISVTGRSEDECFGRLQKALDIVHPGYAWRFKR